MQDTMRPSASSSTSSPARRSRPWRCGPRRISACAGAGRAAASGRQGRGQALRGAVAERDRRHPREPGQHAPLAGQLEGRRQRPGRLVPEDATDDGVQYAQEAFRRAEDNAQTLTQTAERLQATAEQAGKGFRSRSRPRRPAEDGVRRQTASRGSRGRYFSSATLAQPLLEGSAAARNDDTSSRRRWALGIGLPPGFLPVGGPSPSRCAPTTRGRRAPSRAGWRRRPRSWSASSAGRNPARSRRT